MNLSARRCYHCRCFRWYSVYRLIVSLRRDTVISVEPHLLLFRGSKRFRLSELYGRFNLKTPRGRFDCAVAAAKRLLIQQGYSDCGDHFEKRGEDHETE